MPDSRLYILSESEFDDEFLRVIVERVTGWTIPHNPGHDGCHHISLTGINDDDEQEMQRYFLQLRARARTLGGEDPVLLLVVRDNDRGPFSPEADAPLHSWSHQLGNSHRLRQLEECRALIQQPDGHGPVFPCAVGVSVQMIESWILLASDPSLKDEELPLFAEKSHACAQDFYAPNPPPPQLKNLYDKLSRRARREHRRTFNRSAAENADLDSLDDRSLSFKAFLHELRTRLPAPHA